MTAYAVPEAAASFTGLGVWRYRTEIVAPPASGQLRFNNADISLATEFYLHETNDDGVDVATFMALLMTEGSTAYIQDRTDADKYVLIELGTNVDNGVYRTFQIASVLEGSGGEPSQNTQVAIVASSGVGSAPGNVFKVGIPVDDQIGIWTGDGTIEGTNTFRMDGFGGVIIESVFPALTLVETGVTANNTSWTWQVNAQAMNLALWDDAFTTSAHIITIQRTLNVADSILYDISAVTFDLTALGDFHILNAVEVDLQANVVRLDAPEIYLTGDTTGKFLPLQGQYGSVMVNGQSDNATAGGLVGYSIGDAAGQGAFGMLYHDVAARGGFFDMALNQWFIQAFSGSNTYIYYNGVFKLFTTNTGVQVNGNVSATNIGGILQQNLVDKSAVESIAGAWTFNGDVVTTADIHFQGTVTWELSAFAEFNPGPTGNFGQFQDWSTETDFNAEPDFWGWTFVQGTTNGPPTASSGTTSWFRQKVAMGLFGKGFDPGDYNIEMAMPRTITNGAEMWVRRTVNGIPTAWTQMGARLDSLLVRGDAVVQGTFTSLGIDDNATTEVMEIADTTLSIGQNDANSFGIRRKTDTGLLIISGGSTGDNGAAIWLYGGVMATNPGDMLLQSDGEIWQEWDEAGGIWNLYTGTGLKTLGLSVAANQVASFANDILFTEAADHTGTPAAGNGHVWLRNDAPNNLIFTDDAGTDQVLNNKIIQIVDDVETININGTTTIPDDDTIPQITEGFEVMTVAITPRNTAHRLRIEVVVNLAHQAFPVTFVAALFQDSTADALAVAAHYQSASNRLTNISFSFEMAAGTISSTTFRVRIGATTAGTVTLNGTSAGRKYGGVLTSSITVTEFEI